MFVAAWRSEVETSRGQYRYIIDGPLILTDHITLLSTDPASDYLITSSFFIQLFLSLKLRTDTRSLLPVPTDPSLQLRLSHTWGAVFLYSTVETMHRLSLSTDTIQLTRYPAAITTGVILLLLISRQTRKIRSRIVREEYFAVAADDSADYLETLLLSGQPHLRGLVDRMRGIRSPVLPAELPLPSTDGCANIGGGEASIPSLQRSSTFAVQDVIMARDNVWQPSETSTEHLHGLPDYWGYMGLDFATLDMILLGASSTMFGL